MNSALKISSTTLFILIVSLSASISSFTQNMPSLLNERNINSTFSILAFDEEAQEWGIAVATNNIYVGNSTIYIEPGVGAFSVIADTEPRYGIEGLKNLNAGKSIKEAIIEIKKRDDEANYRQIAGIDAEGNVFAFTGKSLKYWNGEASEILGKNYVVMGNQLAHNVLSEMSRIFESSTGTLAERLLISLIAGQNAGGQISGKQSAAVAVKGVDNEWYDQIDLRVDNSKNPIKELSTLMDYHYGRIRLNQAQFAHRSGRDKIAINKLREAETMLEGWTGMYSKIAIANIKMGFEDSAVNWIKKGLAEDGAWALNIPAFYFLRDHPQLKSIVNTENFDVKDWEVALGMLSNLGRESEAIELSERLIKENIESSYLSYLLGRSYFYEKQNKKAIQYLETAIKMDAENIEAQKLLAEIQ